MIESAELHPCCEDVYRAFEDFLILNEVNIPFLVADFRPGNSRLLWANRTCLDAFGALSLEEFQEVDLNADDDDDSIGAIFQDIYTTTQVEHRSFSRNQSLELRALKCDAKLQCRPCQVLLPDEDDVRTVTLVGILPDDAERPDRTASSEDTDVARLKERVKELERQVCERSQSGESAGLESTGRRHRDSISSVTRSAMFRQDSLRSIASQAPVKVHSDLFGTHEILSVDDNLVNHMVVENALEPKGFVVTVCMSGIEALELIKSREYLPDLILLDCMMPEMNGYEMCEQLRAAFPYIAIPVIMVSAKDHEADVVMGLKSGCNDYLKKPYGTNELIARINVHLKLRQLWNSEVQRHISKRYRAEVHIPDRVVSRFSAGADTMLDKHADATVLVLDLVDILTYVDSLPAAAFTDILNEIYTQLDRIVKEHGATRIIDDTYMVVLGDHAADGHRFDKQETTTQILRMADAMLAAARDLVVDLPAGPAPVRVQIGIAAGQAYSALVGIKMTYYTYFGSAVREACELLVRGHPGCAHVSTEVQQRLGEEASRALVRCGEYARTDETSGETVRRQTFVARLGAYEEFLALDEAERLFPAAIPSGEIPTKPWLEPEPEIYLSQKTARHYRAFIRALSTEVAAGSAGSGDGWRVGDGRHAGGAAAGGSAGRTEEPLGQVLSECTRCAQLQERLDCAEEMEAELEAKVLQLCLPEALIPQALMEREAGSVLARQHGRMSILVSNIVAYTALSASLSAEEMVLLVNKMLQRFEELTVAHDCLKIECWGGLFAVAAGHDDSGQDHAERLVRLGLDMVEAVRMIEFPRAHHKHLQIRIGVHTGEAKSGVVWSTLPRYSFFGDTMITAMGLEATGYSMCIHVSDETRKQLGDAHELEALGRNTLKGKGAMETFLIKDQRCAWESAIIKSHHQQLVSEQTAAQQILAGQSLHSAAASFNVPFMPKHKAASGKGDEAKEAEERAAPDSAQGGMHSITEGAVPRPASVERTASAERRSSLEQEWNRLGLRYSRAHSPDLDMLESQESPTHQEAPPPSREDTLLSEVHRLPPALPPSSHAAGGERGRRAPDAQFEEELHKSIEQLNAERRSGGVPCEQCARNLERAEDTMWALEVLRGEHDRLRHKCVRLSSMVSGGADGAERLAELGVDGLGSVEGQGEVEELVDEFLFKQFVRQAHVHHEELEQREALHQQEREERDAFTVSVLQDFAALADIAVPQIDLGPVDEALHDASMRAAAAAAADAAAADAQGAQGEGDGVPRYEANGAQGYYGNGAVV